jgi:hypothetical protein
MRTSSIMMRCILLVIATLIATSAVAHDNPENWIGQEHRQNALGQYCCGENDCHAFTVDEVTVMPDGYHFPDGEIIAFDKAAPSIDHFFWKCAWGVPKKETKCVFAPLGPS